MPGPSNCAAPTGDHFTLGDAEWIDLALADVVLMRQDPPFDMAYITATHLLEHIHPRTLVVNDPVQVRNAPEKLFVTHFPELMPPTLITSNRDKIAAFREEHRDLIVKPLFGNGGAGVFHIPPGDENLNALMEMFTELYREPVIIQAYLPEVREGDKRIILVDGEAVGAINRVPADGEARSNMHVGGTPLKSELTGREKEICHAHRPGVEGAGHDLRRHRRDRRLHDRDQRHLADRHPGDQPLRRHQDRGDDLGTPSRAGWISSRNSRSAARRRPVRTRPSVGRSRLSDGVGRPSHVCAAPRNVDAPNKSGHDGLVCAIYPLVIPRFMRGIHITNS